MRVSIGLPFFNARATLPLALRSIFNQTLQDWELLLLDDGSTDGSLEVAREAAVDGRVRLLADGRNLGLSERLNQLARLARHPVLARMDADDVMHPDRLRTQLQALLHRQADVVGTSAYVIDEDDRLTGLRHAAPFRSRREVLLRGGFIHPTCLGRTAWFRAHPYDASYPRAEDLELWSRTVQQARFEVLDVALLFYREPRRPNLAAYRLTWRTARRIVDAHGRACLTPLERVRRTLRSHAADLAYRLAAPFPALTGALLDRRNTPLTPAERAEGEAALSAALAPPLRRVSLPRVADEVRAP